MGIDYNSFTADTECADSFYCYREDTHGIMQKVPVNKILYHWTGLPTLKYPNYYSKNNSKYIQGSGHYPDDTWDVTEKLSEYRDIGKETYDTFIARGGHPRASQRGSTFAPGSYTLKFDGTNLVLTRGDSTQLTIYPSYGNGILPDRLIIEMQAGGGGGGASTGGQFLSWMIGIPIPVPPFIVPTPAPIPGTDGGGGGSGACFIVVINTALLKEDTSNYYSFIVGSGGAGGGKDYLASAAVSAAQIATGYTAAIITAGSITEINADIGENGKSGGASSISYNGTQLISAPGGGGGGRGTICGYNGYGSGGSGSSVSYDTNALGKKFWILGCVNKDWQADGNSLGSGKTGGSNGAGTSTLKYYIPTTKNPNYYNKDYLPMGGKSGGSGSYSGGGAASFYGDGGNGGGTAEDGKPASGYGAGGGGGRWTAYTYKKGGSGSNGFLRIYF